MQTQIQGYNCKIRIMLKSQINRKLYFLRVVGLLKVFLLAINIDKEIKFLFSLLLLLADRFNCFDLVFNKTRCNFNI